MSARTDRSGRHDSKPLASSGASNLSNGPPTLLLTITQACEALNISWQIWREYVEPYVKLVRLGRCKRVPVVELERFIAEHAEAVLPGMSG
jgi:hypothetical protein